MPTSALTFNTLSPASTLAKSFCSQLLLFAFVALPVWNKNVLTACCVQVLSELGPLTERLWSQTALRAPLQIEKDKEW